MALPDTERVRFLLTHAVRVRPFGHAERLPVVIPDLKPGSMKQVPWAVRTAFVPRCPVYCNTIALLPFHMFHFNTVTVAEDRDMHRLTSLRIARGL